MSDAHESLTNWLTLPVSTLAGHRAIVQLDEGTIIDGYLEYVPSKLRKELRRYDGRNLRIIDGRRRVSAGNRQCECR